MPRIAGVDIPKDKQIRISLTYIYGIGDSSAKKILDKADIDPMKKAKDIGKEELNKIRTGIEENYTVEGDLKRKVKNNIKRLKEIDCWRGIRHKKGLPVRGQTTQKNSRTVRGNERNTVASGQKSAPAP